MSTLTAAVIKDHRELEEYYNQVTSHPNDHDHQQRYGNQFVWELARHSVGEELVVYPAMEKYLGDRGKEMAEEDRKEHHQASLVDLKQDPGKKKTLTVAKKVKLMLQDFQSLKAKDSSYIAKLNEIWETLAEHIKEEEKRDLPALEEQLASAIGESQNLAQSFARTKKFVPSRSHPSAGEHPPFETAMGLLTAPFDKLTDMFRKFPQDDDSANL